MAARKYMQIEEYSECLDELKDEIIDKTIQAIDGINDEYSSNPDAPKAEEFIEWAKDLNTPHLHNLVQFIEKLEKSISRTRLTPTQITPESALVLFGWIWMYKFDMVNKPKSRAYLISTQSKIG